MITTEQIRSLICEQIHVGKMNKLARELRAKEEAERRKQERTHNAIVIAEVRLMKALGSISQLVEETEEKELLVHSFVADKEEELELQEMAEKHIKELLEKVGLRTLTKNVSLSRSNTEFGKKSENKIWGRDLYVEFR